MLFGSARRREFARLLDELRSEQPIFLEEAPRVGTLWSVLPASDERTFQGRNAARVAPTGRRAQVTEPRPRLFDHDTQGVAVAVDIDSQHALGGARRLALDPGAAAPAVIGTTSFLDANGEALSARPAQAERALRIIAHNGREQPVGAVGNERSCKGVGERECAAVQRHADLRIRAR